MQASTEDAAAHARLALVKAEQRKIDSLKHLNHPWVFIEPTRFNFARVPKRFRKPQDRDADDDELAFLRQSKTPFTSEDLEVLTGALHRRAAIAPKHSQNFEDALELIHLEQEQAAEAADLEHLRLSSLSGLDVFVTPDEEEPLLSERSEQNDDLFTFDDDSASAARQESGEVVNEEQTMKTLIMDQLHEKSRKRGQLLVIRVPEFEAIQGKSVQKVSPQGGKKTLIAAVQNASSLTYEADSLTFAKRKLARESALKAAALRSCFAADSFRHYLVAHNSKIADSFPLTDV
jgi:hypothetical protein